MDNQATPKSFALIVGVGNYPNLHSIPNTVNDAEDINTLLTDPQRGGLNKLDVRLLTDGAATAQKIDDGLNWLANRAIPGSTAFFFFSGHGLHRAGGRRPGSFLCPYDVDPEDLHGSAFSREDLHIAFNAIIKKGVQKLVVFLDCCYAGGLKGAAIPKDVEGGLSEMDYRLLAQEGSMAMFVSSHSTELSYIMPNQRNSVFTSCLLEVFSGLGVAPDEQYIYLSDVSGYLSRNVTRRQPAQHPVTLLDGIDLPVLRNPAYKDSEEQAQRQREAEAQAAKAQAEREAREKARKEQAEREAREKAAKEQIQREATEQTARQINDLLNQLSSAEASGNWDRVIELGEKTLKLDSSHQQAKTKTAKAYRNRGTSYHNKGNYDQAIADYNRAIYLDPNVADYYYSRGLSYGWKGNYDQAIADMSKAIQLDPNNASYYRERGVSYHMKGNYDQAIADKSKAIQLDPNNASYYRERGASYHAMGNYDQAIADKSKAIQLDPNNASYYDSRSITYHAKGDYTQAIADDDRAIQLDPNNAKYYYSRGLTYKAISNQAAAHADFQTAANLGHEEAKSELSKL